MPGIVGIARIGRCPLPEPGVALKMAAALAHRGTPRTHVDDEVCLVSIGRELGRSEGADACVVAWDGHVSNLAALGRASLARDGSWAGSDGEVIARLAGARRAPDQLRGSFAVAAWRPAQRHLLLARDPVGQKPLYWARTADFLLFGSEVKAILASGLVAAELDVVALEDLFCWWFPFPPRTMFRGVRSMPPGHLLEVRGREPGRERRYFRAPFPRLGERPPGRARDLEAELIERLRRSVADSIAPGERSAIYLSSGLDSALIASLFASTIGTPAVTLTVTSRDAGVDEGGLASLMTDRLRARDLRLRFQDEPVERFMDAVWHAELPPVAPTLGSAWAAAALLRRHQIPVALTGDGADELFGGHEWHRTERLRSSFDRPGARSLWSLVVRRAAGSAGADRAAADFLLDATREDSGRVRARFGGLYPPWLPSWHVLDVHRAELLAPALAGAGCDRAARSPDRPPEGFLSALREDVGDMHPLDAALSLEFETKLPGWNLLFVERGAAAHGVDARSPFLDRDFVEFAAALPAEMKIRFLRDKAILRRAARGHVPEAIRRRPKRTPPRQFAAGLFDGPSLARVRDHVSESSVARAGLFSWPVIARLFDERGRAPAAGFHRFRIDSVLTLVLGVQLLHDRMVRRLDVAPPAERAIQEPTHA